METELLLPEAVRVQQQGCRYFKVALAHVFGVSVTLWAVVGCPGSAGGYLQLQKMPNFGCGVKPHKAHWFYPQHRAQFYWLAPVGQLVKLHAADAQGTSAAYNAPLKNAKQLPEQGMVARVVHAPALG